MQLDTSVIKDTVESISPKQIQYDNICKTILAHKEISAWILKHTTKEFQNFSIEYIVQHCLTEKPEISTIGVMPGTSTPLPTLRTDNTEDNVPNEGKVFYDIRFRAKLPQAAATAAVIINIEAQNHFKEKYPLVSRAVYYASRLISAQYGTEFSKSNYQDLKKVFTIWLCFNPTAKDQCTINRYCIAEENVFGHRKEKPAHYDLLEAIFVNLAVKADTKSNNTLIDMLSVLFSKTLSSQERFNKLKDNFKIDIKDNLTTEVDNMCNLGKTLYVEAYNEAYGKAYDEAYGKAYNEAYDEAEFKTTLNNIENIIKAFKITPEQAMQALNLSKEEQEKYLPHLKQA